MPIGNATLFTREHIERVKRDTSPILAEQVVHCLELVAQLVESGLSFMFKGGNSLLLLLERPKRFSIDIDIASGEPREKIDEAVEGIVRRSGIFTRFEKRQHKTKPWLPMVSYNLFYTSHFTQPAETFIMLDVQLRLSGYAKTKVPVRCGDIYAAPAEVLVPTVGSLVGDKLLTLGPLTLGIPVGKGKAAQRLKHVCDVATLSARDPELAAVRGALDYCMKQENELQQKELTLDAVLDDTLDFLSGVAHLNVEPASSEGLPPRVAEIVDGRAPFAEHLLERNYPWAKLQEDLARDAFVFCAARSGMGDAEFRAALAVTDPAQAASGTAKGAPTAAVARLLPAHPLAAFFWHRAEAALGRPILK